jgi:hypothetical protein
VSSRTRTNFQRRRLGWRLAAGDHHGQTEHPPAQIRLGKHPKRQRAYTPETKILKTSSHLHSSSNELKFFSIILTHFNPTAPTPKNFSGPPGPTAPPHHFKLARPYILSNEVKLTSNYLKLSSTLLNLRSRSPPTKGAQTDLDTGAAMPLPTATCSPRYPAGRQDILLTN